MDTVRRYAAAVVLTLTSGVSAFAQQNPDTSAARQQRTIDSLSTVVAALAARLDSAPPQPSGATQARPGTYMNVGFVALTDAGWSTAQDVRPLLLGDHDPKVRGFTIPNTELTLDGAVDPYFKGFSNLVFKLDENGETGVELEEAYVLTTSLPANLQLKVGQFFTEFGRQNPQHPHSWAFVDQPVILSRAFGPDGLRSQGVRLSWLAPTPFYTETMVTVANSANETTFSFRSEESTEIHGGIPVERPVLGAAELLVVPRVASSFDLTETQTLLVGASAAFGPNNSGPAARTRIYGMDGYWKWKSASAAQGFPFVSVQAEALARSYDADARLAADNPLTTLPAATIADRGAYGQLLWGIKPRIVAGIRADVANGDDLPFNSAFRGERLRVSPNFTWYPTEFSKVRLQYNFDRRTGIDTDHSLWMQFEFLLGAHAAHKF